MRLLALVPAVLLAHLALLWWLQGEPGAVTRQLEPLSVQIRQAQVPAKLRPTPVIQPARVRPPTRTPRNVASPVPSATPTGPMTSAQAQPITTPAPQTVAQPALKPAASAAGLAVAPAVSPPPAQAASVQGARPQPVQASTLPSADADYLQNPPPVYPALSMRRGEQGTVLVRVLISSQGRPLQGEVERSSGFDRLDQAALQAVMQWRFVAAQSNGVAVDKWFAVPVRFNLDEK